MNSFLQTHAAFVLRVARGEVSGSSVDARDVAQDVVQTLLAMHAKGSFSPAKVENGEAYLRVVVRNAATRARRRKEQVSDDGDVEQLAVEVVEPDEETRDRKKHLEELKSKLRPRDAVAFAFLVEDGLSIEETAKALGTNPNNVYQMRHRILAVAQELLGKEAEITRLMEGGA
ncbi:MAG: sigma-70 family RNA polymerase sigma factor [Polyangiales bacterium]